MTRRSRSQPSRVPKAKFSAANTRWRATSKICRWQERYRSGPRMGTEARCRVGYGSRLCRLEQVARGSQLRPRLLARGSGSGASAVRRRIILGRRGCETGQIARRVLAGCDAAVLHSAGSRRDLSQPADASPGRPLPVGEGRVQSVRRVSHRMEFVGVRGSVGRRNSFHGPDGYRLHDRSGGSVDSGQ